MQVLTVSGMGCRACEVKIEKAIRQVDAEAAVTMERASGRVRVESDSDVGELCRAVTEAGYPASAAG